MNRRYACMTATAVVLLGGTVNSTFAAHRQPASPPHARAARSASQAIVARYFDALNGQGSQMHDSRTLNRLYAPRITAIESLTTGQPRLHTGRQQVHAFDEGNTLSWYVMSSEQLSSSVVLAMEQPETRGPGHELNGARPWLTLFTLRNGQIVNLVWSPS